MSLAIIKEIPNNISLSKFAVYHAFITSQSEQVKKKKSENVNIETKVTNIQQHGFQHFRVSKVKG